MEKPQKTSSQLDDELKAVLPPSDKLMEDSIEWVRRHGKTIAIILAFALVLLFTLSRQSQNQQSQWQEYNQLKLTWFETPTERGKLIAALSDIIGKHPDWLGSWKGLFLQSLLTLDRFDLINRWQGVPSARLLDPNASFSQAIDKASALNLRLRREAAPTCIKEIDLWLNSYGASIQGRELSSPMAYLLQLAKIELLASKALMLEKQNEYKLEEKAWLEWLQALGIEKSDLISGSSKLSIPPIYLPWLQAHGKGRLTLLDYVRERLLLLSKV